MSNLEQLRPDQEAYIGYFSAVIANEHFNALRLHKSALRKMNGELWDILQDPEKAGIPSSELEDTIQLYRDTIQSTEEKITEIKNDFDAACEEAGKRIGPGKIGERALISVAINGSYITPDC